MPFAWPAILMLHTHCSRILMSNETKSMHKIDFVLPWVDGEDVLWQTQKDHYAALDTNMSQTMSRVDSNSKSRYRDWGLLRYWFRAIERFAPWVNNVFFVTCGQKPEWLDESHPKLQLVNHSDYIPSPYLPTFNSNTIELNLHRINSLSEHFVLFNDDVFLLQPVKPEFFFRDGYPVLACDLGIPYKIGYNNISRVAVNNCGILRISKNVEQLVWKNWTKFFNIHQLGIRRALKNLVSFVINRIMLPGNFGHLAHPHLKSTFSEIWAKQPVILDRVSRHKFRHDDCINHYLASAWNMTDGHFFPVLEKKRGSFKCITSDNLDSISQLIKCQTYPLVCINDEDVNDDIFQRWSTEIKHAFHEILPEKSEFEKFDIR